MLSQLSEKPRRNNEPFLFLSNADTFIRIESHLPSYIPVASRALFMKDRSASKLHLKSIRDCKSSTFIQNCKSFEEVLPHIKGSFFCPTQFVLNSATVEAQQALKEMDLFFMWTTSWSTWQSRHHLFLQSLLVTHPNIFVIFFFLRRQRHAQHA